MSRAGRACGAFALLSAGLLWVAPGRWRSIPRRRCPIRSCSSAIYQLTHELRCMQCQSEALADSQVGLAAELRLQVRELLLAGQSDEQIRDHMVARYGEFILFRPRMTWRNAWLWAAPSLLMILGAWVAWRIVRARSRLVDDDESGANGDSPEA